MSLRIEKSENSSGNLLNLSKIPILREDEYFVVDSVLDGDAPKQFIKAYFYSPDSGIKKKNLNTWAPFIAKSAEKWYPHESVIEYMINMIGMSLGLRMNAVRLIIANGQIRFLSRYFLHSNEALVHGAEICGEYLEDADMAKEIANSKKTSRELFTFEFICKAIRSVFQNCCESLICDLVRVIAFDAIVGNNDRHFYNWGVIRPVKKSGKKPKFAPIYDSARGLLWNESEENIVRRYNSLQEGGKKINKYIEEAKPRISIEANSEVNHFELVAFIIQYDKRFREVIAPLITADQEQAVFRVLDRTVFPHFSQERKALIAFILRERFSRLRIILSDDKESS